MNVEGTRVSGHRFVIATGSRPAVPSIPGLEEVGYLDNTTIWNLKESPRSMAIIGGGAVGLEFGQALQRLGVEITIVEEVATLLPKEDPEASEQIKAALEAEGIKVFTNVEITGVAVPRRAEDPQVPLEGRREHLSRRPAPRSSWRRAGWRTSRD